MLGKIRLAELGVVQLVQVPVDVMAVISVRAVLGNEALDVVVGLTIAWQLKSMVTSKVGGSWSSAW